MRSLREGRMSEGRDRGYRRREWRLQGDVNVGQELPARYTLVELSVLSFALIALRSYFRTSPGNLRV